MNILVYKQATGEILRSVVCPEALAQAQCQEGETWLEHPQVDDRLMWVDGAEVKPRPTFEPSVEGTTIFNLPKPTTVLVAGEEYEVPDGVADLDFNLPGEYEVELRQFPYLPLALKIVQP